MNPRPVPGPGAYLVVVANGTPTRPVLLRFRTRPQALRYIGERREYWLSQSLPDLTITERPDQSEVVIEQITGDRRTPVAIYALYTLKGA